MAIQAAWAKYGNGSWIDLETLDLKQAALNNVAGVYVIWQSQMPGRVVRVGHGNIRSRLAVHRVDQKILRHKNPGLLVTWAQLHAILQNSVQAYVADQYRPLEGKRFPKVIPIAVNLPS